jgi:hypothetical protein
MSLTGPAFRTLAACTAVAAALALAACTQRHADSVSPTSELSTQIVALGDTLRVMRGQAGAVDGGRVVVRFDSAGADSRCPRGVQCAWAGDIPVVLAVTTTGAAQRVTLHTGLEPRRATVAPYAIELVDVTPYPGTEPPNARLAQVAVLRVTRP